MEVTLPKLGEEKGRGVVLEILVAPGDHVEAEQPIVEVETDKATASVPSPAAGVVTEILVARGAEVGFGDRLLVLEADGDGDAEPSPEDASAEDAPEDDAPADEAREDDAERSKAEARSRPAPVEPGAARPHVRQLARELGVEDLSEVAGTGRGGVVTMEDLASHVRLLVTSAARRPPETEAERRPLSPLRAAIARGVTASWASIPHVTQGDEADITALGDAIDALEARAERRVSLTSVVVAVAARAVRRFEALRATVDLDAGELVVRQDVHVGVAVDTARGLLVPVVRDADEKGLVQIAEAVERLAEDARAGTLDPTALGGARFTVTNLGGLGTTTFTPIVPTGQAAILGVGRARERLEPDGDDLAKRRVLPLSLSYDHRVLDGADAARFLRWVCEALEQPLSLIA